MIKRLLTLTSAGLLVIVAGLVIAGLTLNFTNLNDEFLEKGIPRQGRVISIQDSEIQNTIQVRANLANSGNETLISIVKIEVPSDFFAETEVGSQIPLLILPGDPPSVRLKTDTDRATYNDGYLLGAALGVLGLVLIWLDRYDLISRQTWRARAAQLHRSPMLTDSLQKIAVKSIVLYDGPFEFSYAEEKTRVDLNDGTSLRINQYRPLADIALAAPEQDVLEILRSAKSNWKLPAGADARTTLAHLLKDGEITNADQFFINRDHLGILSRDEVDNGRWSSWVRGVWQLSSTGRILAGLLSANPAFVRKAADEVLHHKDISLISCLAPHLPQIRKSPSGTSDDKRTLALAITLIEDLQDKK